MSAKIRSPKSQAANPKLNFWIWVLGCGMCCGVVTAPVVEAQSSVGRARAAGSTVKRPAAGEDVNRRNADGSTPLQWAVYDGNVSPDNATGI